MRGSGQFIARPCFSDIVYTAINQRDKVCSIGYSEIGYMIGNNFVLILRPINPNQLLVNLMVDQSFKLIIHRHDNHYNISLLLMEDHSHLIG